MRIGRVHESMIIEFANSAEYWNNRYASARREGRLEDAVVAARNALRLDDCFDNRMDYADLLSELHLARWSASVCLHGAKGDTLDEQLEWLELMMSNCSREAAYGSAMYYQMQLMIKQHGEENAAELGQDLMDFVQSLADEPTEPDEPLQFAEDAHAQENEQLHDEMFEAFNEDDYATVCRLWHRAHPDYPFYREMLFMAGYSYAKLGENDEARRLLWQLYELHGHDARLLYYIDELAGGMRDHDMDCMWMPCAMRGVPCSCAPPSPPTSCALPPCMRAWDAPRMPANCNGMRWRYIPIFCPKGWRIGRCPPM